MYATNALLALYPEAAVKAGISIPALVRSLTNANSAETRQAAAEALSVLKHGDSSLISAWTAALSDESSSIRYLATNALLRLDPEAAAKAGISIPTLIRTLADVSPNVRNAAADALAVLNRGDSNLVAAWTAALTDEVIFIRFHATNALQQIDPEAAVKAGVKLDPIPRLIRALRVDDAPAKIAAATALGDVKGNSTVTAALTDALKDDDMDVRATATNALLRLDPQAAAKAGVKVPSQ
jgi:HEAT repeat protein